MKKYGFISLLFLVLFILTSCVPNYCYIMPENMKSVIEKYNETHEKDYSVTAEEGILTGSNAEVLVEFNNEKNKTVEDRLSFFLYFYKNYEFKKHIINHDDGASMTIETLSMVFGDIELRYDVSGYVDGVPYDEVYTEPNVKIFTKEVFDFSIIEEFGEKVVLELVPQGELENQEYRNELADKYKDYSFTIVT